jgi:rhomboid protease GluP
MNREPPGSQPQDPPPPDETWILPPEFEPEEEDEPEPLDLPTATAGAHPWTTVALVLVWMAIVLTMAVRHDLGDRAGYLAWGGNVTGTDRLDTAWRLLASTFLHDGIAHVFFNAISMLMFGPAVERLFGVRGFLPIYAIGGAAASLASVAWRAQQAMPSVSVGASGAIFALGGALLIAALRLRRRLAPGRARAMGAAMLFLLAQSLSAGVVRHGTDNVAHGAGLLAGAVLAAVLPLSPRVGGPSRSAIATALATLSLLALSVALGRAVLGGVALLR